MWRRLVTTAFAAGCIVAGACGQRLQPRHYQPPGEQLILPDEIAQSGARSAWDVVRRLTHLSTSTSPAGDPVRMYRRGRSSLLIRETPVVVVDGVEATDIRILGVIRADQIASMRVLTGAASMTQFGTDGGAGAVIIETMRGDTPAPGTASH